VAANSNTPLILVVAVVCGLAGGFLGAQLSSGDERRAVRAERYDDGELRAEIEALREEIRRSRIEVAREEDQAAPEAPDTPSATAESADEDAPVSELPAWIRDFKPSGYVESLSNKRFDAKARDKLFTLLSVHKEKIDETIKGLLAAVKEDPGNAELQTALASAYTAKTAFGTNLGPAQGIVFMKALAAYDKALQINPDHWTARFGKAYDTSMAPEFVGLRPQAIRQFEALVERQESRTPQKEFAQTYLRLGTLYKDAGNADNARTMWKRGIEQYPDNQAIRDALELIGEK